MLYNILKLLFQITFKYFFRNTFRLHAERLPDTGPLVICANHPGAFLDPIVIAASTKRRIYFLAKAAVFKGAFAKWLLPKFNMILLKCTRTTKHSRNVTSICCVATLF
jgi:1-acyl-sn-glycerol-3-phosphate acyltransferase